MQNQVIEIQDLEVGDEIMISCQAHFKYLRVVRAPRLSKIKVHWSTKQPMYENVRCTTRQELVTTTNTWNGTSYTRTHKEWKVTPEDHNLTTSVDLNYRQIWLVRRENNN